MERGGMTVPFEYLNDQLSHCKACGLAVADEGQHEAFHAALKHFVETHNSNAKALEAVATQQEATGVALVAMAELLFDLLITVSRLEGTPAAELRVITKEARTAIDQLKQKAGTLSGTPA
jgi:hypothetical protein